MLMHASSTIDMAVVISKHKTSNPPSKTRLFKKAGIHRGL